MKKVLYFTAALLLTFSCAKHEPVSKPVLRAVAVNETGEFMFGPRATSLADLTGLKVFVYSNVRWEASLLFEDGAETWASVYPEKGKDDGRFFINVEELASPYPRTCRLVIVDADDGAEMFRTEVRQTGVSAYLTLDTGVLSFSHLGGALSMSVNSNVAWEASVIPASQGEDVSWLSVSQNGTSVTATSSMNAGDYVREAVVRFSATGFDELTKTVKVTQMPEYKITNATLISIEDALKLDGIVEDNCKIQGYVINDLAADNMPRKDELYIQDDHGASIIVALPADRRDFSLDEKVCVWLTGGIMSTGNDGIKRLTSVASTNFSSQTTLTGGSASPIVLTDVSHLSDYLNCLVTLKGVCYAVPFGTICNVGTWKSGACAYGLTSILDRGGNAAVIRTMSSFPDRHAVILDEAEYDITGIVVPDGGEMMVVDGDDSNLKRLEGERYSCTLRLRRASDVVADGMAPLYSRIATWSGNTFVGADWIPSFGNGEFNVKKGVQDGKGEGGVTKNRVSYCLVDGTSPDDNSCYKGWSTNSIWDASYGGYFYEASVDASGVAGDLYVSFMMANYGTAARYWRVQYSFDGESWTAVPDSDFELWNALTTSASNNHDLRHLYAPQAFVFVIPDAAGKGTVSVRITTQGRPNKRSSGANSAVANTSSTCMYYLSFTERKK